MLYRDISLYAQAPTLAILVGHKIISRLTHYEAVNDFFKRFFSPVLDDGHIVRGHTFLVDSLLRHGVPRPKRVFEQGTGWHGSDAIAFYLLGAKCVHTVDTSRWLRQANIDRTAKRILNIAAALRPIYQRYLASDIEVFDDRIDFLRRTNGATAQLFERGLIKYVVTKEPDAKPDDFEDYDLIFSNSVLQRLAAIDLERFVRSKSAPHAVHFHRIDCADFHVLRNNRIGKLSYLLIDERIWNRWMSAYLNYQNRLRSFEFRQTFESCGYTAKVVDEHVDPKDIAYVENNMTSLAARYGWQPPRDIAITHFTLIAKLDLQQRRPQ
jgi:hypothetical protein